MLVMVPASAGAAVDLLLIVVLSLQQVCVCSLFHSRPLSKPMHVDCQQACLVQLLQLLQLQLLAGWWSSGR
jgi:hypothetical protein